MAQQTLTVFEWEAPEFRHYPKNPAWYITLVIVVTLLVIYEIFSKDIFGAISLIIVAIFIILFGRQSPKIIPLQISDQGIHINQDMIPYQRIKHFWVVDDGIHKTLNFETTAYVNHLLTIELADMNSEEIREYLIDVLPEHDDTTPTTAQKISHRFHF